jgi:SagB-type dehydrogenase family enzyme
MARHVGALALVGVLTAACASTAPAEVLQGSARFGTPVVLPAADLDGSLALEAVLAARRSGRAFSPEPLPPAVVSQLFWAAQGITDGAGRRTAPSAGARYPLELYAVTGEQLMHYLPDGHRVEQRDAPGLLARLGPAAFGQDFVSTAPAVFVITGVVSRTEAEYGAVARRLVDREAGHAAQNLLLQATALGLAAVPVGGFDPSDVGRQLALPPGEEVLYLVPAGFPPPVGHSSGTEN